MTGSSIKPSKIIGIDGNEANVQHRVGSNLFAYQLLKHLHELNQSAKQPDRFIIYLKDPPLGDLPQSHPHWRYRVLRPRRLWTQWRLPADLYLHPPRPQVFFSPGHYAPRKSPVPTVVTVLDLAFLDYPNLFTKLKRGTAQLSQWTRYSVAQAVKVIAISKSTQSSLISHYGLNPDRIRIVYPGVDRDHFYPRHLTEISQVLTKYKLKSPYILSVGTLQPRKNLVRLIQAFSTLPSKYSRLSLVIAGGQGWLVDDINQAWKNSRHKSRISFPGFIESADLPALYSGALALFSIGLDEGFGLPPAEAIACGTLPVVANTGALPEVVGPSGIKVDPFSVTGIRHGIISIMELSQKHRQTRLSACQAHIKKFSWQTAAENVLEVLHDVAL